MASSPATADNRFDVAAFIGPDRYALVGQVGDGHEQRLHLGLQGIEPLEDLQARWVKAGQVLR